MGPLPISVRTLLVRLESSVVRLKCIAHMVLASPRALTPRQTSPLTLSLMTLVHAPLALPLCRNLMSPVRLAMNFRGPLFPRLETYLNPEVLKLLYPIYVMPLLAIRVPWTHRLPIGLMSANPFSEAPSPGSTMP